MPSELFADHDDASVGAETDDQARTHLAMPWWACVVLGVVRMYGPQGCTALTIRKWTDDPEPTVHSYLAWHMAEGRVTRQGEVYHASAEVHAGDQPESLPAWILAVVDEEFPRPMPAKPERKRRLAKTGIDFT